MKKDFGVFSPYKGYYSEFKFMILPGSTNQKVKDGIRELLKKLEIEIIAFIPSQCRKRIRWYVEMPKDASYEGKVGWEYKAAKI